MNLASILMCSQSKLNESIVWLIFLEYFIDIPKIYDLNGLVLKEDGHEYVSYYTYYALQTPNFFHIPIENYEEALRYIGPLRDGNPMKLKDYKK
jgi:hypothetical protein